MELASLSSEVGMEEFTRRYNLLKSLRDMWTSGRDAVLCQCPGMHTAAQDHCNDKIDGGSTAITADHCPVDGVCEGDESTNADPEDVDGGSAVKDVTQAGKGRPTCAYVCTVTIKHYEL